MVIKNYFSLVKFRICSLITFSAVVGFIFTSWADISPSNIFFLILATMLASMSASMFNHYFDRDIDGRMVRTCQRPIPSGLVQDSKNTLVLAMLLFLISLFISIELLNYMVGLHLFLGAFVYGVIYTAWLKRRTWMNIIIGGLAGSFAVLAGGASSKPELCLPPLLLAVIMFFWTPSHFWSFAIVHREDYAKAGIPMLPVVIGSEKTARYILCNTLGLVLSSFLPVYFGYLGIFYAGIAGTLGIFFIARNIQLLLNTSKECARKNFIASMIYLGILFLAVIADIVVN